MKRFLTTIILTAACIAAYADAKVEWQSTTCDLGAFDEDDGRVWGTFVMRNTGDEPLTILSARASCGCTTPSYERRAVAPGDTASVRVAYDPVGRPGKFEKKIYIETNTEPRRSVLTIKGVTIGSEATIARRYPVSRGKLRLAHGSVLFGSVKKLQLKTLFEQAYNASHDSIVPVVTARPPYVDVAIVPPKVAPGEQMSFIYYLRSDRCDDWGLVTDSVSVLADSLDASSAFTLPTVAIVNEDFDNISDRERAKAPVAHVDATNVDFGRIDRDGGVITRTVTLRNDGRNKLEIRRIYSVDPSVNVRYKQRSLKRGKSAEIIVSVDPSQLPGAMLDARLSIITNDPTAPTQSVRLTGEIMSKQSL